MSLANCSPPRLGGTPVSHRPLRRCSRCDRMRDPHGGVETSPTRWRCGACWRQPAAVARAKAAA